MSYVGIGNRQDYIADFPTQSFNGDGSTTTFTLNFEAVTASIRVAVDNVLQPADGSSYYVDGNSLTFSSAPASGTNNISVVYLGTVRQISTVSDNSIANSKIQYPLTESGATVSTFNRTTSEGSVLDIQKDGTTRGIIATEFDGLIFSNDTRGIKVRDDDVIPRNVNLTTADNVTTLGSSGSRFKDLYLGGNIYLGGTGSANALDDYEEGTWTPSVTGGVTVSTANYVKIGRFVHVNFAISAIANNSGDFSGLPFTWSGISAGIVGYQNKNSDTWSIVTEGSTGFSFRVGGAQQFLGAGDIARCSLMYMTA